MPNPTRLWRLRCPSCGHSAICANADMMMRLRGIGMLKREKTPDAQLLDALLPTAVGRLPCEACQHVGLTVAPFEDEWDDAPAGSACSSCGAIIPSERLELFPRTKLCAACQQVDEAALDSAEPDYCPRCGGLMKVRATTQGGVTRYVQTCSACGK